MLNTFFALISCLNISKTQVIDPIVFQKNIDYFVFELNQHIEEIESEPFVTTKIESFKVVKDENSLNNLILDFDGNNGIIVINEKNEIVFYKQYGDCEELRSNDEITIIGSEFFSNNQKIDFIKKDELPFSEGGSSSVLDDQPIDYDDISNYISSKYSGFNFVLEQSKRLQSYSTTTAMSLGYHQYNESIYHHYNENNGLYYSEGNCYLVAIANAIAYYSEYGYRYNFPSRTSTTQIVSNLDFVYDQAIDNGFEEIETTRTIHTIYKKVRDYAMNYCLYPYVVGPFNTNGVNYAFSEVCSFYEYEPSYTYAQTYSLYHFFDEIHLSHPTQLYVSGDSCYHNHGMMITGAKSYVATVNTNVGTITYRIVMVSIYDGHSYSEKWYDLNYLGNMPDNYKRATSQCVGFIEIIEPDE